MFESISLKMIEAGALLVAGIAFGWWQLADIKKAQAASARAQKQAEQNASSSPPNP
jgi:hypothetical protein